MSRSQSAHTWIGTIASVLAIIGWLTGLQTIWEIGNIAASRWDSPEVGLGIALLILSLGIVWGAFFILSTTILARSKVNVVLNFAVTGAFVIMALAIGLVMYDAFFDFNDLPYKEIPLVMSLLLIFVFPIGTTCIAGHLANEWACGYCGRFSLKFQARRNTGTSEERTYITKDDGSRLLRIYHYGLYDIDRRCENCGTVWTYHKSYSLGHHDYQA